MAAIREAPGALVAVVAAVAAAMVTAAARGVPAVAADLALVFRAAARAPQCRLGSVFAVWLL